MTSTVVYQLSGDRNLFPTSIRDDGVRMFMDWSEAQPLPAVLAVGASGQEEVVNGYMRSGTFVIDRVYDQLVFRLDKASAFARRKVVKGRQRH